MRDYNFGLFDNLLWYMMARELMRTVTLPLVIDEDTIMALYKLATYFITNRHWRRLHAQGLPTAGARLKMKWTQKKWRTREWKKRKWVLSLPRELIQCKINVSNWSLSLSSLSFFHSFMLLFPNTLTHRHTGPHTPDSYWLPKLPLNFHLALQLVSVPAPLVHSPKPLEALLTGRSMTQPQEEWARDSLWVFWLSLFLPSAVLCTCLSGQALNFPQNTPFFPSYWEQPV